LATSPKTAQIDVNNAAQLSSLREIAAAAPTKSARNAGSALARLETPLRLINDVDAAFAPHQSVIAMAAAQGFQRVTDFHGIVPFKPVD
jgi:hypothetical protein